VRTGLRIGLQYVVRLFFQRLSGDQHFDIFCADTFSNIIDMDDLGEQAAALKDVFTNIIPPVNGDQRSAVTNGVPVVGGLSQMDNIVRIIHPGQKFLITSINARSLGMLLQPEQK